MKESGKLIFMVDDDKVILNLLEYVFQGKNGYTIKSFDSGEACLENMHMNPDLVVLDYILNESNREGMNGLETLRKLIEKNRNLPVIILSGYTDDHTRVEMLKNGARKVLSKDDYFVDKLDKYIAAEIG
ncbi:MAG: response regulator [Bacteroidales bacterium]